MNGFDAYAEQAIPRVVQRREARKDARTDRMIEVHQEREALSKSYRLARQQWMDGVLAGPGGDSSGGDAAMGRRHRDRGRRCADRAGTGRVSGCGRDRRIFASWRSLRSIAGSSSYARRPVCTHSMTRGRTRIRTPSSSSVRCCNDHDQGDVGQLCRGHRKGMGPRQVNDPWRQRGLWVSAQGVVCAERHAP